MPHEQLISETFTVMRKALYGRLLIRHTGCMPKDMDTSDFRAVRRVLTDADFGLVDNNVQDRSDLVDEKTWRSLMTLPDDVAITTSDRAGAHLKALDQWSSDLLYIAIDVLGTTPLDDSPIGLALFNAKDDYEAGVFSTLNGFYRAGHSCLRNALEYMTIGLNFELSGDVNTFKSWQAGQTEFGMGRGADLLSGNTAIKTLETHLQSAANDNLFRQKNSPSEGSCRRLFSKLSGYTHGGPGFTEVDIRNSNGPVWVGTAFASFVTLSAHCVALVCVFAQLSRPTAHLVADGSALKDIFDHARGCMSKNQDGLKVLDNLPSTFWI